MGCEPAGVTGRPCDLPGCAASANPCAEWQFGAFKGTARIWISDRIAWQIERLHARHGTFEDDDRPADGIVFTTEFADCRRLRSAYAWASNPTGGPSKSCSALVR
jgi:hypothetical protein